MKPNSALAIRTTAAAFIASIVLLFPVFVSDAFAQRDEDRPNIEELLPETTVAIVQIPDIRDLVDKTMNGTAGRMLEDEAIAPLRDRIIEEAKKAYAKVEEEAGLSMEEIGAIPSGEMVFAMIAPRRQKPVYMVILETGEENEAADKAYGVAMEKVIGVEENQSEQAELESGIEVDKMTIDGNLVFIAKREGLIIGCSNEKVLNDFFTRWDGGQVDKVRPLSANRKFITIMNRCSSQKDLPLDLKFFFDPIAIAKSVNRGNVSAQLFMAMIPSIGLDSVLALGGSAILGDEEYESIMHAHLLLSNPRKGVTKMISLKPNDYEPEQWIPFDALDYFSTSWDAPQMIAELRELVDLAVEEGTFDNFVKNQIDRPLGMPFEEEVLPNFSGRFSNVRLNADPGKLNAASNVIGLELTDVEAAKEMLEKAVSNLNGEKEKPVIEKREYNGFTYWVRSDSVVEAGRTRRQKRLDRRNRSRKPEDREAAKARSDARQATMRQPRGVCGLLGDSLLFCDSIEAFELTVTAYQGETPTLRNDQEFLATTELMTRLLGTDSPCGVFFSNPKHQIAPILDFANSDSSKEFLASVSDENEMLQTLKGVLDDHELPTVETLGKYMAPQGGFATTDDTGYHLLWFQRRVEPTE